MAVNNGLLNITKTKSVLVAAAIIVAAAAAVHFLLPGISLVFMFVLAIVVMFLVLAKIRLHPFLAILGVSVVFGIAAGIPLTGTPGVDGAPEILGLPGVIGLGFSGIFTSLGMVVIFGVLIGAVLETSGAAIKIASMIIKLVGKKSPTLSFMVMGWIVSISVYCDSGFVALNPLRRSMVKRTGVSSVATAAGLGTGLYLSHVLVPFAPGPLIAADRLGLGGHLPLIMLVAAVVSIPALIGAYFYTIYIGKKRKSKEDLKVIRDDTVQSYTKLVSKYKKLPNGLLALTPILVPILLMILSPMASVAGWTGFIKDTVIFLGTPIIAMAAGVVFAVILLVVTKKTGDFNPITENTLKTVGPTLCITGAGGVFGEVILASGVAGLIAENMGAMHSLGLFFPFLFAALIKTAQGSSAVAMVMTAGVIYPFASDLSVMMSVLTVMAIGAGSMIVSHANDSYFWTVARLSGMSPRQAYASHTVTSLVGSVCCMIAIFVFSLVVG